jgi:hypothetical protein
LKIKTEEKRRKEVHKKKEGTEPREKKCVLS